MWNLIVPVLNLVFDTGLATFCLIVFSIKSDKILSISSHAHGVVVAYIVLFNRFGGGPEVRMLTECKICKVSTRFDLKF